MAVDEVQSEPCVCVSIGWVLRDDDKCLVVYTSKNDSGQISGTTYIMRSCIINFKVIHPATRKRKKKPKTVVEDKQGEANGALVS
jgi:hypothetical protein